MRDIAIVFIVLSSCVISLRKPYIGYLVWVWISLMNPHRLAYGFAVTFPVAQITIIGVMVGLLLERDKGRLFQHGIVGVKIAVYLWMVVTTIFAIYPDTSLLQLDKVSKIFLGVFISYLLINSREKFNQLVWITYLSVGFFGIKGGFFTLKSGGGHKVWGPEGSFIGDNNTLALALLMIMPLGAYLVTLAKQKYERIGLIASMGLIGVSVLGSQSRGAFLGLIAVTLYWLRKAPGYQRLMVLAIGGFIGTIALYFMPESFWERMNTVKTYDKDASAMGRINAWWCAFYLALDRVTGAGFDYASGLTFRRYAPDPLDVHTAHSIYFQMLGDHGFVGLILYLWVMAWTWLLLGKIINKTRDNDELKWANTAARMFQLSVLSYATAGAFLSLTYYDLYWDIVAMAVILNTLVSRQSEQVAVSSRANQTANATLTPQFVKPIKTSSPHASR